MKKPIKKPLRLATESIRPLDARELAVAAGGGFTDQCMRKAGGNAD